MAVITVYLRCNCVRIVHFLAKLREIMRCISIMQVLNALFILLCLSLIAFVGLYSSLCYLLIVLLSTRDVAAQSKFRVQGFSVVRKVEK